MSKRLSVSTLAAIVFLGVPAAASAHARLDYPPGRDMRDDHKDGNGGAPCGIARAASQPSTALTAGASVEVKWTETVNHPGCFLIDFSSAGDANFQMLANVKHVATGAPPRVYTKMVALPAAPCTACTLRVRQIMLSSETATCPPATIPSGVSYYACGNVVASGGGGPAPPPPTDGGTDARPTDGGSGSGSGGSSASGGATGSGGESATGGGTGSGGSTTTGGVTGSGGAVAATGGVTGSGGASAPGTGGHSAAGTGGAAPTGGSDGGGGGCSTGGGLPADGAALGIAAILLAALAFARLRAPRRRSQSAE